MAKAFSFVLSENDLGAHFVFDDFDVFCDLFARLASVTENPVVSWYVSPLHSSEGGYNHRHFVVVFLKNIARAVDLICSISTAFGPDDHGEVMQASAISVESVKNIRAVVRYLIHYDNPEKQQFKGPEEIISNDLEIARLFVSERKKVREISFDDIFDAVRTCSSLSQVGQVLGPQVYCRYWRLIELLFSEYNSGVFQRFPRK